MIAFDEAGASLAAVLAAGTDADVELAAPRTSAGEPAIDVHLLAYRPGALRRHRGLVERLGSLEYLVAVSAPGDRVAGVLHDACLAIDGAPGHELVDDAVPLDWWTAFGVPPRPALRVTTAVVILRPVETAPEVTEPLAIDHRFIDRHHGQPQPVPTN